MRRFRAAGARLPYVDASGRIRQAPRSSLPDLLLLDEPYRISPATADAVARACRENRRVVAIGTTVVRALEHSAAQSGAVTAGAGTATQRLGTKTRLRVVDAIVSGTHEPGTSHYELLHAFATSKVLRRADRELNEAGFTTHEFGDSVLIERDRRRYSREVRSCAPHDISAANASTGRGDGGTYTPRFFDAPVHVVQESRRLSSARRLVGACC